MFDTEAQLGPFRADLVLRDPQGRTYVAEAKLGAGAAHVGSTAQVARAVDAYKSTFGASARGVLITDQRPTPSLVDSARSFGVEIVRVEGETPEDKVQAVVERLRTLPAAETALGGLAPTSRAGFWSYVRADDEADDGRITRLASLVRDEYALLTGEDIAVFVDRESLSWGDEWQRRIDEALEGTAFFIPVLTPRYFRSSACRRELLTFAGHAKSLHVSELLLPLLYVDVPSLFDEESDDEAIALIARMQYEDWRELRLEDGAFSSLSSGGSSAREAPRGHQHGPGESPDTDWVGSRGARAGSARTR
jgi:hypothetical protein